MENNHEGSMSFFVNEEIARNESTDYQSWLRTHWEALSRAAIILGLEHRPSKHLFFS